MQADLHPLPPYPALRWPVAHISSNDNLMYIALLGRAGRGIGAAGIVAGSRGIELIAQELTKAAARMEKPGLDSPGRNSEHFGYLRHVELLHVVENKCV